MTVQPMSIRAFACRGQGRAGVHDAHNFNEGGSVVQSFDLIGHSNGPGTAAAVVLKVLMDRLVKEGVLKTNDVAGVLFEADRIIKEWGDRTANIDARKVLDAVRGYPLP
jgi:hypothetical protein